MVRLHDAGTLSGRVRSTIGLVAREQLAASLIDELRARPGHEVEVIRRSDDSAWLRLSEHLDAPGPSLAKLPGVLASLGWDAIVEPTVFAEGGARGRIVVPAEIDPAKIVDAISGMQRALGFESFRLLRVGAVAPDTYTSLARRVLAPEQDELLALAAKMGYYDTPKAVTLGQIAQAVGLSVSPVHKRLKSAEERLVALQVQASVPTRPRKARREHVRPEDAPWEGGVQMRAPALGPAPVLVNHPEARALLVPQSVDAASGAMHVMMLLTGNVQVQSRVRAHMAQRPEVSDVETIAQDGASAFYRFVARGRQGYGLAAWSEAMGDDAVLRSIVVEGTGATLRFMVVRPRSMADVESAVSACAKAAGWQDVELSWLHRMSRPAPPMPPEPLTPRQEEVLRVATALGYYRTPRQCTLEGVANALGVSANAIHKNLVLAESKLIASYLSSSL